MSPLFTVREETIWQRLPTASFTMVDFGAAKIRATGDVEARGLKKKKMLKAEIALCAKLGFT